ncbi:MAG: hypothetical protein IJX66_11300 [Lachnospiraceae bacterium]|nr:hypothetical protein [Lachnospiraceae bacterium]
MKKLVAMMLTCVMALSLVACGNSKAKWTEDDLTFKGASDSQEVKVDHAIIVYEDVTYYTDYADGDFEEFSEEFVTNRGLELGMTMEDYKKLYNVKPGYAVWELYSGSQNEYTSFEAYSNQEPDEMYDEYNNAWLDIGYTKVDGKWEQLEDHEVMDTWFCDADMDAYEEVVIFAVNFDTMGQITGISLEHFTYDEAWVEWQGWVE